jgi:hypothetical protein
LLAIVHSTEYRGHSGEDYLYPALANGVRRDDGQAAKHGLRTTAGFDVVLERDGRYPSFSVMLEELDRARAALNQLSEPPVRRYA